MLVSSILWVQCMTEKQNLWHKLAPNMGTMVARHFQYPATNTTASIQHLTTQPRVKWKALCFSVKLAATGWLWVNWPTVWLCSSCGIPSQPSEKEKWRSWEDWVSLKQERWPQTPKEACANWGKEGRETFCSHSESKDFKWQSCIVPRAQD